MPAPFGTTSKEDSVTFSQILRADNKMLTKEKRLIERDILTLT